MHINYERYLLRKHDLFLMYGCHDNMISFLCNFLFTIIILNYSLQLIHIIVSTIVLHYHNHIIILDIEIIHNKRIIFNYKKFILHPTSQQLQSTMTQQLCHRSRL